ncbi:uncharacterized protein LOC119281666 [Triticum dicoccoides]|uniref:uncharacterized protein LOC119281666 n=1 Tax=Triticum dicoccoides TaxID=85692 RepID=UPI0018902F6C|nr:uncharacterized protein LOC119281666 [Triticum dicoccoides]
MACDVAADEPPAIPTVLELRALDKAPTVCPVQEPRAPDKSPAVCTIRELRAGEAPSAMGRAPDLCAGDTEHAARDRESASRRIISHISPERYELRQQGERRPQSAGIATWSRGQAVLLLC